MVHSKPEGCVLAGMGGDPPVRVLSDHREVGTEHGELGPRMAYLCNEVRIWSTCHVEVCAHDRNET